MLRALIILAFAAFPSLAQGRPGDSVYHLDTSMVSLAGEEITLSHHEGHPVLVSMFYATCPHVCPAIISNIKRIERALPAAEREELRVLMVSLDPDRDTPQKLRELAAKHGVDTDRWVFATPDKAGVRKIAAILGIKYRRLPNGEFNHSTLISLLDGEGRVKARTARISDPEPEFVEAVREHF